MIPPLSRSRGSAVSGDCSVLSGLLTQLNAANSTSPVTGLITGILNQVLGLTGGNAASVEPLTIDLGGSTSAVSSSANCSSMRSKAAAPRVPHSS